MSDRDRPEDARGERLAERMRWRATSETELVAAMRKGSYGALREFYARFEPLLARYAARARVPVDDWEDAAYDVLSDVVMALIASDKPVRARAHDDVRDIHAYIQRAFRNRMLDARRSARRRDDRDERATSGESESRERMVLATCSESALRAAAGDNAYAAPLSPAIARLATVLGAELSAGERQMLTWVGNAVPMREIASWLEISYAAAKVRLSRTRSRLRVRALRHVHESTGAEREELIGFFRRSSHGEDTAVAQPSRAAEPGGAHGDD